MLTIKLKTVAAAINLAAAGLAAAQSPIKIGYLGTFSGPIGTLGQDNYDGFMLAIEQRGGKLGNMPVQVLKEDDQFKPDVGLQIVQKFIEKEQEPIIAGVIGSNVMMAVHRPITDPPRHNSCRLLRNQEHGDGDEGHQWHVTDNHSRTGQ